MTAVDGSPDTTIPDECVEAALDAWDAYMEATPRSAQTGEGAMGAALAAVAPLIQNAEREHIGDALKELSQSLIRAANAASDEYAAQVYEDRSEQYDNAARIARAGGDHD